MGADESERPLLAEDKNLAFPQFFEVMRHIGSEFRYRDHAFSVHTFNEKSIEIGLASHKASILYRGLSETTGEGEQ